MRPVITFVRTLTPAERHSLQQGLRSADAFTLRRCQILLASADGLLTNDSGPGHLSAALGKRTWVLWSGTAPSAVWKPRGGELRLFEAHVPCAPCAERVCPVAGHPCLTWLEPGEIARSILADLGPPA